VTNFPDISWYDGYAQIDPNPAYGTGNNQLVDSINDYDLEQFINAPTSGNNTLRLRLKIHVLFFSTLLKVFIIFLQYHGLYFQIILVNSTHKYS